MKRRKKIIPLAIITLLAWLFVGWLAWRFEPEESVRFMIYDLRFKILFFPLIFIATSLLFALLFNHTRRGILLGLGVTIFLILRLLKLTHPFYLIIVILTMVAFELAFRKR